METERKSGAGSLIIGISLILLGAAFFLDDYLDFDVFHFGWPLFVTVPGVAVYLGALPSTGQAGKVLSALGSSIAMAGLVLFYQNTFDHFESWAYAWALVAPTAPGLGWIGLGLVHRDGELARQGARLGGAGLAIFIPAAVFFELVIGISGFRLAWAENLWPVLLIVLGFLLFVRSFWPGSRNKAS